MTELHLRLNRVMAHVRYLEDCPASDERNRELAVARERRMYLLIKLELEMNITPDPKHPDFESRYKAISRRGPQPETKAQAVGVRSDPIKPSLELTRILDAVERGIHSLESLGENVSVSDRIIAMQEGQVYGLLGLLEEHFKLSPVADDLTITERYWKLHSKIHR